MRIEDYALIGDMHTAALVGRDGSIDWLCLPRFDSAACFAALLDEPRAGRWLLAPADRGARARRRYREDTLILETTWETSGGRVRVLDFMPPRGEAPDVIRVVEGLRGRVELRTELTLRFGYGDIVPWTRHDGGQLAAVAGPDSAWLDSPVPLVAEDGTTTAGFAVSGGDRLAFVLTWQQSWLPRPARLDAFEALDDTERAWTEWMRGCAYRGQYAHAVRRSLLTLKALTYAPTGGVLAAPTTSLPELVGGTRNWDYRYSWLRDATYTLRALLTAGYEEEATAWRDWLLRAVAGHPADLQIMYTVDGTRRVPEWRADWLRGYEDSRPVRIGNAAGDQVQLDVYGEVLDCLYQGREEGLHHDDDAWELQRGLMDHLEGHWRDPDHGLWEVRGPRRHFVHSKVLAWVAADRMAGAVERQGRSGPAGRWKALREEIHREVCERGFDPDRNTFTQFYGSRGLDAALLLIPRLGFLPPSDERVTGTVEAVRRELSSDGLIMRYSPDLDDLDELAGGEGAFLACSFWLADALALQGRPDKARELFERLLDLRNDVGLLSEEYDTGHGRQVGNFPQAYSHVAIVNTASDLGSAGT
ncbi:glycoside hydrolase family 15 protein [Nonomuraea jiangxiensis]|uniref:Trehalase n=1 Tax=Nonomuraea jiangxiensis TaxID=633440 RepID=A0A1G9F867_9ACTN|nr:glycoside hydrolase family 15 protein [Nonomuraea jiangxiensis]SDK84597.1 Glucoamylase (glucan-1,4-alpha-glucosidase), GH15 family [Nonomuraea jiangxiensis]